MNQQNPHDLEAEALNAVTTGRYADALKALSKIDLESAFSLSRYNNQRLNQITQDVIPFIQRWIDDPIFPAPKEPTP